MKLKVRRFSAFGDDNHTKIDDQIDVLKRRLTEDEIFERLIEDPDRESNMVEAANWLTGEESERPSAGWAHLVQK